MVYDTQCIVAEGALRVSRLQKPWHVVTVQPCNSRKLYVILQIGMDTQLLIQTLE